jgi:cephalosporin hydroxylase
MFSRFLIRKFRELYFRSQAWAHTYWLGVPVAKCPTDLWAYQEILVETRPEVVIETGTYKGGSALFFASVLDLLGKGMVVTIDLDRQTVPKHPRIHSIIGNSVEEETVRRVEALVGDLPAMVVLDSDHRQDHVLKELEIYQRFVPVGGYLVVEDTIVGHPILRNYGPGPMEAVEEFLRKREDFIVDSEREKFLLTFHPRGFLKRVAPSGEAGGRVEES